LALVIERRRASGYIPSKKAHHFFGMGVFAPTITPDFKRDFLGDGGPLDFNDD
jgi:hypothetical protein